MKRTIELLTFSALVLLLIFGSLPMEESGSEAYSSDTVQESNEGASSEGEVQIPGRDEKDTFFIQLRSRTITQDTPPIYVEVVEDEASSVHVIIQFDHIPNIQEREHYNSLGVELLSHGYLHTNAWFASVVPEAISLLQSEKNIKWVGSIEPRDRLSPALYGFCEGVSPDPKITDDQNRVHLFITFFSDVPKEEASEVLLAFPVSNGQWDPILNGCTLTVDAADPETLSNRSSPTPYRRGARRSWTIPDLMWEWTWSSHRLMTSVATTFQ